MNNKIVARIVAVVMAVAMLGTLCFADNTSYSKGAIKLGTDLQWSSQGQVKTFIAFATNDSNAALPASPDDVVAIYQGLYNPGTATISAERLADKKYIVVLYNGNQGFVERSVLDTTSFTAGETLDILSEITIGETTYKDVLYATGSFTMDESKSAVTEFGIHFTKDGDMTDREKGAWLSASDVTAINAGTTVEFSAAIFGADETAEGIVAIPYINYKN